MTFFACVRCGGLWFDLEGFRSALQAGASAGLPETRLGTTAAVKGRRTLALCPIGGEAPMVQYEVSGIQVDVCHEHKGVWFDAGEIQLLLKRLREAGEVKQTDRSSLRPPPANPEVSAMTQGCAALALGGLVPAR